MSLRQLFPRRLPTQCELSDKDISEMEAHIQVQVPIKSEISTVNQLTAINCTAVPVVSIEPSQFFMAMSNNDESDVEEKLDNESEKQVMVEDDRDGGVMQIDSVLVHRAFESLQAENAQLQKELGEERGKNRHFKPHYDYLEQHFTEYVQQREEYKALLQKHHDERVAAAAVAASAEDATSSASSALRVSRETQTWKSIICSYCSKTNQIINNRLFKDFVQCQSHAGMCISSQAYEELERRFAGLKEAIRVRETIYENRTERAEIITLRAALRQAQSQLEHLLRKNRHGQYCLEQLKCIIWKLAADPCNVPGGNDEGCLEINANEQNWIDQILTKCSGIGMQTMKQLVDGGSTSVSLTPSVIGITRPCRSAAELKTPCSDGDF